MKNLILIGSVACSATIGFTQTDTYVLEQNNVSAILSNNGVFFNDATSNLPGYEVPTGSGNHLIYAMSFWFGGTDINGQVKLAAQTYTGESDFFPGALTNDGPAIASIPPQNAGIYPVLKSEIDYHIAHFNDVGYVVPASIANWPAHGDYTLSIAYLLAPFEDVNGDGMYNPANGDYPKIKGDEAVYMILNDKADIHGSTGDPIGLEIHYLFYQFNTADYRNDVTFLNMRVINRGTQTLYNFHSGCFVDPAVGNGSDDYAGYSAVGNVMYAYNSDNNDADYGANPPALGITLLSQQASGFNTFTVSGPTTLPTSSTHYLDNMQGMWSDGSHFTQGGNGYGGTVETNFLYSGNPNDGATWSELSAGNIPGERSMLLSADHDVLKPFQQICFDYAIIYNKDGNNLQNVQNVIDDALAINTWYAGEDFYCEYGTPLGLKRKVNEISVYPNPSKDGFYVNLDGVYDLDIFTMEGRSVYRESKVSNQAFVDLDLETGVYLIIARQDDKTYQYKMLIE